MQGIKMSENIKTAFDQFQKDDSLKDDPYPHSKDPSQPSPEEAGDPGLDAQILIARYHNIAADAQQLRHAAGLKSERFSEQELSLSARSLGLKTRIVKVRAERLANTPFPALALDKDGRHFVLARCDASRALVLEHHAQTPVISTPEAVMERCNGRMMLFTSRASMVGDLARFDFSWFVPAVVKYRKLLLEVLGVSAILQLFGLVSPLMFQVVMDKVLVNRAFSTLNVVCIVLLISSVFEVILTGLRNYVFSHTTNRIDVELGARLFRHLLALPIGYFAARRVGDTVARVRELENIRNFLTGQALTAIIDLFFSIIFIGVMCLYSLRLTLIVVLSLPVYAAISATLTPILRARLNEKFNRGANNQSFLVETVSAAETVKAMAVEPQFTRSWDNQLAGYVAAGFRVSNLGNIGQQLIQVVGKLVTILTLFFGAKLVIDGALSIGQLIAFNMMSQRVAAPVLRLAQLWQDMQQIGISMQRLGDILNARTEIPQSRQALPDIKGGINFENVRFRYRTDGALVLSDVSIDIRPGQIIGVVGRSGSGKSTLTKLVQRLYLPEGGKVSIDGIDLALADPAWLRRHVGVVLQENILFNRSIRENIAITDPGTSLETVIHAAQLAGAHDFICEMPEGYDTKVGEHGTGLSGGQRQRIAIARALVTNPRILIFDEATSALDFETERIIQQNMQAMCRGRTVIIIAHRLTSVRHADKIFVIEKGEIIEQGGHKELLDRGGQYAHMVSLQNA
jgi:ATP-binding cassette, subfamily B, bacterial HlyB/CyaB